MKKTIIILLICSAVCALSLASCTPDFPFPDIPGINNPDTACRHEFKIIEQPPTCVKDGSITKECTKCSHEEIKILNATGHTELIDEAVSPTCEKPGLTAGKHCSVCNVKIEEQITLEPLGHSETVTPAVAPTCEATGLTEGKHCSLCNKIFVAQNEADALGHSEEISPAVAPTCASVGYTEGTHCSVCQKTIIAQVPIAPLEHTEIIDGAVQADCVNTGLTEGKHCSVCGTVIVEQKIIPELGHRIQIDAAIQPTITSSGLTEGSHCSVCGTVLVEQTVIPMLPPKASLAVSILTLDGSTISGKFSNSQSEFSFIENINVSHGCAWTVSTDAYGINNIASKVAPLSEGDNTFYIHITNPDQTVSAYTVNIYRNRLCAVSFNTCGGTEINTLYIEEGRLIEEPITARQGYTFGSWDYDFSLPIAKDTVINATWIANTNTPYFVEYYLQNTDKSGYDIIASETESLYGTTDSVVTAKEKMFKHFTIDSELSTLSAKVSCDGSLTLKLYYTREVYTLSVNSDCPCLIVGSGSYVYGSVDPFESSVSSCAPGYEFYGWYSDGELLSEDLSFTFTAEKNVEARFEIKTEMQIFEFTSTSDTCHISGIKDNSVTEIYVPDYVTSIADSAFKDCTSVTTFTAPFTGTAPGLSAPLGHLGSVFSYKKSEKSFSGYDIKSGGYYYEFELPQSLTSVVLTRGEKVEKQAFYNCSGISKVTLPDTVTSINEYAFGYCTSLTETILPDSLAVIGSSAFSGCTALSEAVIPDSVTVINYGAYQGCTALKSLAIGKSVVSISDSAFSGCTAIETIYFNATAMEDFSYDSCPFYNVGTLGNGITVTVGSDVTKVPSFLFYSNSSWFVYPKLAELNFDEGSVCTSIGNYAFAKNSTLTDISLPDSLTEIGSDAFYLCTGITSVTIPINLSSIGYNAFGGCSSLTEINFNAWALQIDDANGERAFADSGDENVGITVNIGSFVTKIPYRLFMNVVNVAEVNFAEDSQCVTIEDYAFYSCERLESIIIPDSVTNIGNEAFYNCDSLTNVTFGKGIKNIGNYAFDSCNLLTSAILPNGLTSLGRSAFHSCYALEVVSLPDTLSYLGEYAFSNCNSLVLNEYDGVYYIGNETNPYLILVEAKSYSLTEPTIHSDTRFIHSEAFSYKNIQSIEIHGNILSIGNGAFEKCSKLTTVIISDGVERIGAYAFNACTALTTVSVPSSVTSIGTSAFSGCDSVAYNEFDNGYYIGNSANPYLILVIAKSTSITSCEVNDQTVFIHSKAFQDITTLKSVSIGKGVLYIGEYAFSGCTSLSEVVIPDSVMYIDEHAFSECTGLKKLALGKGLKSLGDYAFYECTGMNEIYFNPIAMENKPLSTYTYTFYNAGKSSYGITVTIGKDATLIPDYLFYYYDSSYTPNIVTLNFEDGGVCKYIGAYAFSCTSLKTVNIGKSVEIIGKGAFDDCKKITTINFNAVNMKDLEASNRVFFRCGQDSSGITVNIGTEVTRIPAYLFNPFNNSTYSAKIKTVIFPEDTKCTSIGAYAFYLCTYLEKIDIPSGMVNVEKFAFYYCSKLVNVVIPDTVEIIGDSAFSNCTGITSVTIGNNVKQIGAHSFSSCSALVNVEIGEDVSDIGSHAFYYCKAISRIVYRGTEEQWESITKGENWDTYFKNSKYHPITYTLICNNTP